MTSVYLKDVEDCASESLSRVKLDEGVILTPIECVDILN